MSTVTGTGSRASVRASATVSARVPPAASAFPAAAATPRLVVPIAGKPASASAAPLAKSHAFGSTSGRSPWWSRRNRPAFSASPKSMPPI